MTQPQQGDVSAEGAITTGQLHVREMSGRYRSAHVDEVLSAATALLANRMRHAPYLDSPAAVKDYLRVKLAGLEHEVFGVVFLDAQHCVIAYVELFRGTVAQTSVYPREVVKEALRLNCSALIAVHNHPSGLAEPSQADIGLTQTLKSALSLVDVRVLDHLIVAGAEVLSMAERGLM